MMKARGIETHASDLQLGLGVAQSFYREMDKRLAESEYLAGDEFSIADISLLIILDFGAGPVFVPTRWTELPNLTRWHKLVSARPSVQLFPDPYIKGEQRYSEFKGNDVWKPRPKL